MLTNSIYGQPNARWKQLKKEYKKNRSQAIEKEARDVFNQMWNPTKEEKKRNEVHH